MTPYERMYRHLQRKLRSGKSVLDYQEEYHKVVFRYLAVNESGTVLAFEDPPYLHCDTNEWRSDSKTVHMAHVTDSTGWETSLVEIKTIKERS